MDGVGPCIGPFDVMCMKVGGMCCGPMFSPMFGGIMVESGPMLFGDIFPMLFHMICGMFDGMFGGMLFGMLVGILGGGGAVRLGGGRPIGGRMLPDAAIF